MNIREKLTQFYRDCWATDPNDYPDFNQYYDRFLKETNTPHNRALRESAALYFECWIDQELNKSERTNG
jgi:hypothetical protein